MLPQTPQRRRPPTELWVPTWRDVCKGESFCWALPQLADVLERAAVESPQLEKGAAERDSAGEGSSTHSSECAPAQPDPALLAELLHPQAAAPQVPVREFIIRLVSRLGCSSGVWVVAGLLIGRLAAEFPNAVSARTVHRVIFAAVAVAAKIRDDGFSLKEAAAVAGLDRGEAGRVEIAFLRLINFKVDVPWHEYAVTWHRLAPEPLFGCAGVAEKRVLQCPHCEEALKRVNNTVQHYGPDERQPPVYKTAWQTTLSPEKRAQRRRINVVSAP
eukprot:TRINITY_DN62292_c0_g1_i1.p1 TRINITY_DN62292_c0_g1~~TRINITY_DN62292_c0_g1_i1.p1  ORF type:complete len:306 (+),score=99.25 TRINITY_DN62292_c0_g1_i1:101-919(+)